MSSAKYSFLLSIAVICLHFPEILPAEHSDTEIASSLTELSGVWRLEGYGQVLEIRDGNPMRFDRYEITGISCLLIDSGLVAGFEDAITHVLRNRDSSRFTHMYSGALSTYAYNRLSGLPALCANGGTGAETDPLVNFDVLWETFDEHYAFFTERGVNWDALRNQVRPQLNAQSSDEDLFDALMDLLTPLCDGHVELESPLGGFNTFIIPSCRSAMLQEVLDQFELQSTFSDPFEFYRQEFVPRVLQNIEDNYLVGSLHSDANGKILWGDLGGGVGYLNILQMAEYAGPDASPAEDLEALAPVLDTVMLSLSNKSALILDVRLNTGGYDHVALNLANRFAAEPRVAFTKKARWSSGFTIPQNHVNSPAGVLQFSGPVVILTSGLTASAAENFLLAMHRLPQVTLVGETTVGVHSDVLQRHLPNGWLFTLSNEVYATPDGTVFEGRGFEPDIEVASLRDADLALGHDLGIEVALSRLSSYPIDPGFNGNWWGGPGVGGEGLQVEIASDHAGGLTLIGTFYTYDLHGNQVFLVAVGPVNGDSAQVQVFITDGGVYGAGLGPGGSESQWGSGIFTATGCASIHMSLQPNAGFEAAGYTELSYELERLATPAADPAYCPD